MSYDPDDEPTHAMPTELEEKLVEAKEWYDARWRDLKSKTFSGSDNEGAEILEDVLGIVEQTWGFAEPLPRGECRAVKTLGFWYGPSHPGKAEYCLKQTEPGSEYCEDHQESEHA